VDGFFNERELKEYLQNSLKSSDPKFKKLKIKFFGIVQKNNYLSNNHRQATLLMYKNKKNIDEISKIMNITKGTAHNYVNCIMCIICNKIWEVAISERLQNNLKSKTISKP
jgi:hypothetical protein